MVRCGSSSPRPRQSTTTRSSSSSDSPRSIHSNSSNNNNNSPRSTNSSSSPRPPRRTRSKGSESGDHQHAVPSCGMMDGTTLLLKYPWQWRTPFLQQRQYRRLDDTTMGVRSLIVDPVDPLYTDFFTPGGRPGKLVAGHQGVESEEMDQIQVEMHRLRHLRQQHAVWGMSAEESSVSSSCSMELTETQMMETDQECCSLVSDPYYEEAFKDLDTDHEESLYDEVFPLLADTLALSPRTSTTVAPSHHPLSKVMETRLRTSSRARKRSAPSSTMSNRKNARRPRLIHSAA